MQRGMCSRHPAALCSCWICGIYGLYWCYKAGDKLDRIKQQWGIPSSNTGILYLILSLLGLDIVVWALVQNEVNGMTGAAA